ncbi:hypothetical protein BIW11_10481 [Tropilaelaps mercedesae]|uniref:Monocarboxylate transporter n=1 Tax=Tropilaelaps mercedesae TaxID=418985 RepID=A0A1V9XFY6_9ACAR|nr:hypothetical protein BIW11_10481 [Tropilaelaps mercedesae]
MCVVRNIYRCCSRNLVMSELLEKSNMGTSNNLSKLNGSKAVPCGSFKDRISLHNKNIDIVHKPVPANEAEEVCDISEINGPKDPGTKFRRKRQWTGPDCSWSWTIAVACSLLNFFTSAVLRSSSVLYFHAIDFYGVSRAEASWAPFLVSSVSNLSGFGVGLNIPAVAACLNLWFDKKKVIASGIIYTGTALGSLFFPFFLDFVVSTLGFRGGIALLGAMLAHGIACALVIRTPPWVNIDGTRRCTALYPQRCLPVERFEPDDPLLKSGNYLKRSISQHSLNSDVSEDEHAHIHTNRFHEAVHHHTVEPVKEETDEDTETAAGNAAVESTVTVQCNFDDRNYTGDESAVSQQTIGEHHFYLEGVYLPEGSAGSDDTGRVSVRNSPPSFLGEMSNSTRRSRTGSIKSASVFTAITAAFQITGGASSLRRGSESSDHRLRLRRNSSAISTTISLYAPAISVECAVEKDFEVDEYYGSSEFHEAARATPQADLSTSALLYLVGFTFVMLINCSSCFQTIILDHAHAQGVGAHMAIYLLWGFALCDITGRLTVGLILETGLLSRPVMIGSSLACFGFCLAIAPMTRGFLAMMALCMFIGFSLGISVILMTVLVGDYSNDLSRITMYIGWMSFASGVTGLMRPLVIGFFRDNSGHYGDMLRLMGLCAFSCGFAWHIVSLADKIQNFRQNVKGQTVQPEEKT